MGWVLWSQLVGFTRPDGQPEQVWLRLELFESAAQCRETLSQFMTYELDETVKPEQQRGSTVKRYQMAIEFRTAREVTMRKHYRCLPDTVDPRGAKIDTR